MREVSVDQIHEAVKRLALDAAFNLPEDVLNALRQALQTEESERGKSILRQILENAELAQTKRLALCQDTGLAVLFVELGQDVHISGGNLIDAINSAVAEAYAEGYLRKSACHPLTRKNTGNNTPAIVHISIVEGDRVRIVFMPKGGGSENMSRLYMLKPKDGADGIVEAIVKTVDEGGANACPPLIVGVGVGGNFERSAILAKRALMRKVGGPNPLPEWRDIEQRALERINALGIGPMGLGGTTTALAVHVEAEPCHIASLPVAVNLQCHSARHKETIV